MLHIKGPIYPHARPISLLLMLVVRDGVCGNCTLLI